MPATFILGAPFGRDFDLKIWRPRCCNCLSVGICMKVERFQSQSALFPVVLKPHLKSNLGSKSRSFSSVFSIRWRLAMCDLEHVALILAKDRCHTIAWHPSCRGAPPFEGSTVRLASGAADSRVSLWSLSESQPVSVLEGHEDSIMHRQRGEIKRCHERCPSITVYIYICVQVLYEHIYIYMLWSYYLGQVWAF